MRQFIRGHLATEQMKIRATMKNDNKALRVQAYERLALLCERMKIMSLILRLNNDELDSAALKNTLLISIQKEYEHNLTQQIYVSEELWAMITLLKDNIMATVTQSYVDNNDAGKASFEEDLIRRGQTLDHTMGPKVLSAIRKEVELYFQ